MESIINSSIIKQCQYIILPGKCPADFARKDLYNKAFDYWKSFWQTFFNENNLAHSGYADDFFRQDFIPVFLYKDEIVAMHLYTLFDFQLTLTPDLDYFKRSFNTEYMNILKNKNVKTAMSLEFLTVNPDWRKSKTGVSFAQLLVGIATKVQKHLNIDASIAISRSDVKVTQMGDGLGWDVIIPNVEMHTKKCDLIALFNHKIEDYPDPAIREHIEYFWNNRIDLTGKFEYQKPKLNVA